MAAGGRPAIAVEGAPQLRRALRRFGDRAADLRALHADLADVVADRAEELVPVLDGTLRDTIRRRRGTSKASVTAGGPRAVYGPPIHFGWRARNIEPQLFLYGALDERRDEVIRRYHDHVEQLVHRFDSEAPD